MDASQFDDDEVSVTVTLSRTYRFTTTPGAVKAGMPGAEVYPPGDTVIEDAADVVYALLSADTIQRDQWVRDIAEREGDVDDDTVEIEEVNLA